MKRHLEVIKDKLEELVELHDYALGLTAPYVSKKRAASLLALAYIVGTIYGLFVLAPYYYQHIAVSMPVYAKILNYITSILLLGFVFIVAPSVIFDAIFEPLIRVLRKDVTKETILQSIANAEESIIKELKKEYEVNIRAASELTLLVEG